jgi:DNA-binding SARP family transcriptional activator
MSSKITYRKQFTRCGKDRCRKCKEGAGHGPYWYAYWSENGRTISKYIGIRPPAESEPGRQAVIEVGSGRGRAPLATNHGSRANQATSTEINGESGHSKVLPLQSNTQELRIYALGQFRVERLQENEWRPVVNKTWHRRRARALLGCLLSSPARRLGREQAIEALWPDLDIETASNRLNGAVHELRQILEPGIARPAASRMLRLDRDVLELADRTHIWIDAEAFESLLKDANALLGIQGNNEPTNHLSLNVAIVDQVERLLEKAAALYNGDYLLEELYSEWAAPRREALKRNLTGLLLHLAKLREARGAFASAMEPLNRLLATDPTDETAVQRLMILLSQLDRRGEALNTYRLLATRLERNYDSEPLPETHDLYEKLRQGHIDKVIQPKILITNDEVIQEKQVTQPGEHTLNFSAKREILGDTDQAQPDLKHTEKTIAHIVAPFVSTNQLGRHNQNPLIGRERELEIIRQVMFSLEGEEAPAKSTPAGTVRNPHVLLLMGEAGIGKTRLAEELSHEAHTRGWAVAWTRAYEQEGTVPYRPWIELLRSLLQHAPSELLFSNAGSRDSEAMLATTHFSPTSLERLSTLLPELRDILPQTGKTYQQLPPEQERLHLWEATTGLISTLSKTTPLLLVLDDLHWTDGSSRELLAYITRHIQGERILLLGTCRDVELSPNNSLRTLIADLRREQAIITLAVQPLTQSQIGTLVAHLPQNIVQSIQTQAAGNPFFAEELARMSETAHIMSSYPEYLQPGASLQTMGRGEEGERFKGSPGSTLPESIAAVLERRLGKLSSDCQILLSKAAVLGGSFEFVQLLAMANEHQEDAILDLLEEALHAGLLTEEGSGSRITYHFWHPLIVSHLYERISAARCAQLHRRAANALLQAHHGHEGEIAAAITYHLSKGGDNPIQVAYFAELAGEQAYSLSAFEEAEQYYIQAIQTITDGKLPLNESKYKIAQRSLAIAERLGDQPNIAIVTGNIGEMAARSGNLRQAEEWFRRSLATAERINEADQISWCNVALAATLQDQGNLTEAADCIRRSLSIARSMKSTRNIGGALIALADLRIFQAIIVCELQDERNLPGHINQPTEMCTRILLRAKSTIQRALTVEGLETELVVEGLLILASAHFLLGDLESAKRESMRTLAEADQYELSRMLGRSYRLLGRILAAEGDSTQANAYFEQALQVFRDRELRLDYARTFHGYGVTLIERHKPGEAHFKKGLAYLHEARDIFAHCHAAVDLEWVDHALAIYSSTTVGA